MTESWVKVRGESMTPMISPGDEIKVRWLSEDEPCTLRIGDLVLGHDQSEDWIVHRFLGFFKKPSDDPLLKGDASFCFDQIKKNQIFGKVVSLKIGNSRSEKAFEANALDRLIARCSRLTVPAETVRARIMRRAVRLFSSIRKATL